MSTLRWIGKAQKTAQIDTITLTAYDVTTTYSVTINGKTYSKLGVGGTTSTTAAALVALLQASTEPEFLEYTWTVLANVITATVPSGNAGRPSTLTAAVSGGTGTISNATTTANASPNDVNNANNYDSGAVPVSTNDLILDVGNVNLLYNLGSLSGVTLNSFTRRKAFTGSISLPEYTATNYFDYRPTELAISATTMTIEQPSSDSVAALKFNVGSVQTALTILGDGPGSLEQEQMWWRGTHVSNVVSVLNGSLAVAPKSGQTAVIATLNAEGSTVRLGSGCTLTAINATNSTLEINSNVTTLNQKGDQSVTIIKLAPTITTANILRGQMQHRGQGTITTLNLGPNALADFSTGEGTLTITNTITMGFGSKFWDPRGRVTNPVFALAAGVQITDVVINCGTGRTVSIT